MISIPFETQKTQISQKTQKISFLPQFSQKSQKFFALAPHTPPTIPKNPKKFEISQPRFRASRTRAETKKARTSRASPLYYLIQTLW